MLAKDKIKKALRSCYIALDHIEKGQERKAIKDMHFAKDYAQAAIHLIWTELDLQKEEEDSDNSNDP